MTSSAALTPRNASDAIMNGRIYRLCSPAASGTQRASAMTSWRTASRKSSTGSSGSIMRAAEDCRRAALRSGRKSQIDPSACRYAFMPSKISWP